MRKFTCLILLAVIGLAACKKSNNDRGCINSFTETFSVSAADQQAALALMQSNNLSTANLKFTAVSLNQTINANGQSDRYDYIYFRYYASGLPVYNSDGVYSFKNGTMVFHSVIDLGTINLGKTPQLKLNDVRGIFVDAYNKEYNTTAVHVADSCLRAEFGYYAAEIYTPAPNATPILPTIYKAWKVQFANTKYPIAYIRDDNSTLIGFDSGIIPFASKSR